MIITQFFNDNKMIIAQYRVCDICDAKDVIRQSSDITKKEMKTETIEVDLSKKHFCNTCCKHSEDYSRDIVQRVKYLLD